MNERYKLTALLVILAIILTFALKFDSKQDIKCWWNGNIFYQCNK